MHCKYYGNVHEPWDAQPIARAVQGEGKLTTFS